MMRTRLGERRGFTLLETSVTIAVIAVVAMLGYAAFAMLIDRRAQLRAAMVETERAAALRSTLEDWFARSYLQGPLGAGALAAPRIGGANKDMLSFVTRAPMQSRAWATVAIMYVDENIRTPQRGLTVRHLGYSLGVGAPWLTYSDLEPAQTRDSLNSGSIPTDTQLDDRIVGLRVEYLDRQTNRWVRDGNAVAIQPVAARVTLEGAPDAPLHPLLQLPFIIPHHDSWQPRQ